MPTINQLALLDEATGSDQIPVYSVQNGDSRRISLNSLLAYFQRTFASPTVATALVVPGDGFSLSIPAPQAQALWVLLQPAAPLAAGTLTLPLGALIADGVEILITTTQDITALSIGLNNATAAYGAPTTLDAGEFAKLRWYAATNSWYRVG
jgi:hypothetical protein